MALDVTNALERHALVHPDVGLARLRVHPRAPGLEALLPARDERAPGRCRSFAGPRKFVLWSTGLAGNPDIPAAGDAGVEQPGLRRRRPAAIPSDMFMCRLTALLLAAHLMMTMDAMELQAGRVQLAAASSCQETRGERGLRACHPDDRNRARRGVRMRRRRLAVHSLPAANANIHAAARAARSRETHGRRDR